MCFVHLRPALHTCKEDIDDEAYNSRILAELRHLCSMINDEAVCQLASKLNSGKTCIIEHSYEAGAGALMGCANYHARIHFQDGSPPWLLRVPRVASFTVGFPPTLADYLIKSEYATLKFLETTKIPAPKAFGYGICRDGTDHGVGVSFLLLEELPGEPWTGGDGSTEEKDKIWSQLADILVELECHPLPKAGSLTLQSSAIGVSAVASDRFVVLSPAGPFSTAAAYYTAFTDQYLTLIADGQLYTEYPVNAYLVYRFLKDNVAQLADLDTEGAKEFFLKHVDDKGDHLLVDENLNITGVIDWQMARVVPRREAFGPSLVTVNMSALCNGKVSLSADDVALVEALRRKGISSLPNSMIDEKARRFFWGLALEPEWSYALPLANAILEVFGVGLEWAQWRETALKMYKSDERLHALIQRSGG
ncbi:hypothetical protein NLG97_g271 [Lecanicillium saksenae]|uniref:Uncharacterized protein n=1 Tax=Lecanicillium saksenae TaxID=468837 RepID=A0ACC1R715_9HYPO|nr:hypothetical protein NLG97_g271 [Lecanicillium saksenae]